MKCKECGQEVDIIDGKAVFHIISNHTERVLTAIVNSNETLRQQLIAEFITDQ